MKELSEACPRYARCSVNKYPLHSRYPNLSVSPDDYQRTCLLGRDRRVRIASENPEMAEKLTYGGLTPQEHSAKTRYEALSDKEKAAFVQRGKNSLRSLSLGRKGIQTSLLNRRSVYRGKKGKNRRRMEISQNLDAEESKAAERPDKE